MLQAARQWKEQASGMLQAASQLAQTSKPMICFKLFQTLNVYIALKRQIVFRYQGVAKSLEIFWKASQLIVVASPQIEKVVFLRC